MHQRIRFAAGSLSPGTFEVVANGLAHLRAGRPPRVRHAAPTAPPRLTNPPSHFL